MLIDFRSTQPLELARDACKLGPKRMPIRRDLSTVRVAMLHQTGCFYDVVKYQIKAAHGDPVLARHERARKIHAHATAMRHGSWVWCYEWDMFVQHGDVANGESVGLEHEGLFDADGVPINPPPGFDLDAVIEAGREMLTRAVEDIPNLALVVGHIQSRTPPKRPKTSDPGKRIFRAVGIDHGVRKLGLTIDPAKVWGNGRPIPASWYA